MACKSKRLSVLLVGLVCQADLSEAVAAGPSIQSVRTETGSVGLYEKFELHVDLKAT